MPPELRRRATGIVIKEGKILLIQRIKPGEEYYVFPGGGLEMGESIEEALVREVGEELSLEVTEFRLLFDLPNGQSFFLIEKYNGIPELGGPEKVKMNEENQYHLVWRDLMTIINTGDVFPVEGAKELLKYI